MADSQAHAYISGIVQGVSFRYFAYHEALKLGLSGWVRNLRDGRVEAVFVGDRAAIERMLDWCKEGPPAARVHAVDAEFENLSESLDGFHVRPTPSPTE